MDSWNNYVVKEEPNMYSGEHTGMPLPDLVGLLPNEGLVPPDNISMQDNVNGFQSHFQSEHQEPSLQHQEQQVDPAPMLPSERSFWYYTCDHPSCIHYNIDFGFPTMQSWVQHLQYCGFRHPAIKIGTTVEHLLVPVGTLYQLVPTQRTVWHQAPNTLYQHITPTPMVHPPRPSFQEILSTYVFNSSGVSDNAGTQNVSQDMGPPDSSLPGSGFFC